MMADIPYMEHFFGSCFQETSAGLLADLSHDGHMFETNGLCSDFYHNDIFHLVGFMGECHVNGLSLASKPIILGIFMGYDRVLYTRILNLYIIILVCLLNGD